MIALLQRVSEASVQVNGHLIGQIGLGLLAFVAIEKSDQQNSLQRMLQRILGYRIFSDQAGKMNQSLRDIDGALLLVPQFTLAADTKKGMRPSFSGAAPPDRSKQFFEQFVRLAKEQYDQIQTGEFGADMKVALINDGPVTFWLQCT